MVKILIKGYINNKISYLKNNYNYTILNINSQYNNRNDSLTTLCQLSESQSSF